MFAGLAYVIAHVAPVAVPVAALSIIVKLLTHAIDDEARWRRLMFLVVPLLVMFLALTVVAVWWLLGDGGLQVVLHDFGAASVTPPRSGSG